MRDVADDSDEEDAVLDELGEYNCCEVTAVVLIYFAEKEEDESEPEEDEPEDEDARPPPLPKGEKNSQLTVGYKGDRSYVVRGNNIGVFSHTGEQVKYYSTIGKIAAPKTGRTIKPKQV